MRESLQFYIDGAWVEPAAPKRWEVINPATEQPAGVIALGDQTDVDRAVAAAKKAFRSFSRTSRQERIEMFESIIAAYRPRRKDLAEAITDEMGAPAEIAENLHALIGQIHLKTAMTVLKDYKFEQQRGTTWLMHEPIGVCALITPWNWPINQIAAKVSPALACGCTMVLKASEYSPFSAQIWTEIMHAAGVPAGVFNMVHGDGPTVGAALSSHPDIDMVSFTGSTRAGIEVARNAAPTIKRVHQELGGKSANIILADADIAAAVTAGVKSVAHNSGQSCNAPTRMLVPASKMAEAIVAARAAAEGIMVGDPKAGVEVGPVVSKVQFDKIQGLIEKGMAEGATLVAGGPGRPDGIDKGYFVRPTVFADVKNDMTIAREEIFGPVLSILGYADIEDALEIANDTPYGLAGYIQGTDPEVIAEVASRMRAGQIIINQAHPDPMAPFGGYKQSGNGREWGDHAFEGFLEVKAMLGHPPRGTQEAVARTEALEPAK
ncbi:aldehyde dehydrogenase family protein [Sphingomonas sp. CGMCC 1.13654]|uniref:aldehyde dehydrogenase (NAD(+)) n=1 Tax=Sphingomonas chungangi TaxID=2683589 RepID=A0A838L429_9SPHN|nr:aldehyde dehydrogenase family protein [Sphingomonas chungangi]MBA2933797.1 aldehyde dehydrogenase family protein [Sphingomonas chungangi]MVW55127.1 aldehyde dehydrogenase family protein [Sphingomonas chungangi]